MTPDREKNLRMNFADMATDQLINTAVQMQDVIDAHVSEKTGFKNSIGILEKQVNAFKEKISDLEDRLDDTTSVGTVEFQALQEENETLKKRVSELTELNEGLQRKLLA